MFNLSSWNTRLLLIASLIKICFLPAGILHAQENSSSSREQNKVITVEEYVLFLNECAIKDPYHLYEVQENSILRFGAVGEYQYSFLAAEAQKPVTLLSTLDVIRYDHWKYYQNEELGDALEVTEQGIHSLQGEVCISINDKHSSCLKMDCLLKTNLCDFCLTRKEEPIFQPSGCFEETSFIGLALLFELGGLGEEVTPHDRPLNLTDHHAPIPESLSRTASPIDLSNISQHIEPLSNGHDTRRAIPEIPIINDLNNPVTTIAHAGRDAALDIFCQHYNRTNEISKKIEQENNRYEELIQTLTSLSEPEQSLRRQQEEERHNTILLLLQGAQRYQDRLNNAARENHPRETTLQNTITLANTPNRLELLAEEIWRNYDQLALCQKSHHHIEGWLHALYRTPEVLLTSTEVTQRRKGAEALFNLHQAIQSRTLAIEKSVALIQELPTHDQKNIKEVVSILKRKVLAIVKRKIDAINLYQMVIRNHPFQEDKQRYLESVEASFSKVNEEQQKEVPNQGVIEKFAKAATLHGQAAAAWDADLEKAKYLNSAGLSFFEAAEEAQKENPNQGVIERYIHSAELFEQGTVIWDNHRLKAEYLIAAANNFFMAIKEVQKQNPNQRVIERYNKAAELFQHAGATYDNDQAKAKFLSSAALSFFMAASEAQQPYPNQQTIRKYVRAAKFFEQAVTACDTNLEKATYLNNVGSNSFHAAEEKQKLTPDEEIIKNYIKAANLYEQAVQALDDSAKKAAYLDKAACNFSKAAEEQQSYYDKTIIERYLRAASLYEQAGQALNTNLEREEYLDTAAFNFFQAAKKQRESNHDVEIIEEHLRTANFYEQKAKSLDTNFIKKTVEACIQSLLSGLKALFMGLKAIINRFVY